MKKLLVAGALSVLIAPPAFAQQKTTMDQILRELEALNQRVGRLEQDNTQLKTENVELKAENDRLVATSEYLKDNASATRKQLANDGPKVAEAERITKAAEWASRISWKADFRYRHEYVDPEEAVTDQTRQRIRARLAMSAKINDTTDGHDRARDERRHRRPALDQPDARRRLDAQGHRHRPRLRRLEADRQLRHELRQDAAALVQGRPDTSSTTTSTRKASPPGTRGGPFFANVWGYWLGERGTRRRVAVRRPARPHRPARRHEADRRPRLLRRRRGERPDHHPQHGSRLHEQPRVLRRCAGQFDRAGR